jgi:RNA polymerase sigma factor (sigma-70 family)
MGHGPHGTVAEPRSNDVITAEPPPDEVLLNRFIQSRDEEAFATLVRRHGPMVLGVCRRVLRDREDAQDAFQVTFLVLARKAASVARAELLANWLYGVAFRTASHMRGRSVRRSSFESQRADVPVPAGTTDERQEILAALDEELNHLPEMYRTLLVLCYLEGKSFQEAARQTACPAGSVSWRVTRAREMLHKRLRRRGLVFPAALLLVLLGEECAAAAVSDELAQTTASTAAGYAGGAAVVPPAQTTVIDAVIGELADPQRSRWAIFLALALLLALLSGGALLGAGPAIQAWAAPATETAPQNTSGASTPAPGCGAAQAPSCSAAPGPACQAGRDHPK